MEFVQIAADEAAVPIELPVEADGTLLMTTLVAQYPNGCGLKYKSPQTGGIRGIRIADGKLHPPGDSWGSDCYYVVYGNENKRKCEDAPEDTVAKVKRAVSERKCVDLIVLGLSYNCDQEQLKSYFGEFGTVQMAQIKSDFHTGKSKGFGFIRFADYEVQAKVLAQRHSIAGRDCDVRLPLEKDGRGGMPQTRKIFVGRCGDEVTKDVLQEYFGQFGEVTDTFIPHGSKGIAFVTFGDPDVAAAVCEKEHFVGNSNVRVTAAIPKSQQGMARYGQGYGQGYSHGHGYGRGGYGNGGYGNGHGYGGGGGHGHSRGYGHGHEGGGGGHYSSSGGWQPRLQPQAASPSAAQAPPPPATSPPSTGGSSGSAGMTPQMVEQMSSIMAAALTAATQNIAAGGASAQSAAPPAPPGTGSSAAPAQSYAAQGTWMEGQEQQAATWNQTQQWQ